MDSVPSPLFAFMDMMLLDPNIRSQISIMRAIDNDEYSLSHFVISNAVKSFCKLTGNEMCHS